MLLWQPLSAHFQFVWGGLIYAVLIEANLTSTVVCPKVQASCSCFNMAATELSDLTVCNGHGMYFKLNCSSVLLYCFPFPRAPITSSDMMHVSDMK